MAGCSAVTKRRRFARIGALKSPSVVVFKSITSVKIEFVVLPLGGAKVGAARKFGTL